jgi:hypothetical protein
VEQGRHSHYPQATLGANGAVPHLVVNFDLEIKSDQATQLLKELDQALADLGLTSQIKLALK